jgi:hypothetical protein
VLGEVAGEAPRRVDVEGVAIAVITPEIVMGEF